MTQRISLADCEALDRLDVLRHLRDEFHIAPGMIYLDGNSLGPLTRAAQDRIRAVVEQWGSDLIQAWSKRDWIGLPDRLGARIARLIGVRPDEVTVGDSTSVNLFKLVVSACGSAAPRRKVVTELGNFPTDLYVLQGIADLLRPRVELHAVPRDDVQNAIDDDTALVVLTHVHYKSAEVFDLPEVTRRAHACGARVLWDLSHSVGALPVSLGMARADFAVGCSYKYLNGGPGAPAFLYVRRDLQDALQPGIAGWLGHASPFDFSDQYRPAPGVGRHRCGTPGIVSMAALDGSLSIFDDLDMVAVREKSVRLTNLFIDLVEQQCEDQRLALATPRTATLRGSHVAYRHEHGYEIMQALIAEGVIGDFRAPDVLRFGFTPLYTRYVDVWQAVQKLRDILGRGTWRHEKYRSRGFIT